MAETTETVVKTDSKFKSFAKRHKDTLITLGLGAMGMAGVFFLYYKQEKTRTDAYIDFLHETNVELSDALDKNSEAFIDSVNTKLGIKE